MQDNVVKIDNLFLIGKVSYKICFGCLATCEEMSLKLGEEIPDKKEIWKEPFTLDSCVIENSGCGQVSEYRYK